MQDLNAGVLQLTLVEANLTRDTELMGSMSPYVTFVLEGKKYKSKTLSSAGKTPKWKQKFTFEVQNADQDLMLRVWDQDLTTSDPVGFVKLKMSSLIINKGVDAWFDIMYENKGAGKVHLMTQFEPEGGDQIEQFREELQAQNEVLQKEAEEAKQMAAQMEAQSEQLKQDLAAKQAEMAQQKQQLQQMMAQEGAQSQQVLAMQQQQQAAQAKMQQQEAEIAALKARSAAATNPNAGTYAPGYMQPMQQQMMMQPGYGMQQQPMMMQQPGYGMQQPMMQPGYGQPMMQQPMMQQPMMQPGYGQPMMQQPGYGMQQPMMMQQPGYGMQQQPMMMQQPGYGQPMMQQPMMQQPMAQMTPYCLQMHPMQMINYNPFSADEGIFCDKCKRDVKFPQESFYHCFTCGDTDFCMQCAQQHMR